MLIWRFAGLQSGAITATECSCSHYPLSQHQRQQPGWTFLLEHQLGVLVKHLNVNVCGLDGRQQQQWRDLGDILKLCLIAITSMKKPEVSRFTSSPGWTLQIKKRNKPWSVEVDICRSEWANVAFYIGCEHEKLPSLETVDDYSLYSDSGLGASTEIAGWLPDLHMSNWLFWLGGSRGGGGAPPSSVAGGGGGAVAATPGLAVLASCAAGASAAAAPGSEEGGVALLLLPSLLLEGALSLRGSDGGAALSEGSSEEPPCVGAGWESEGVSVDASSSVNRKKKVHPLFFEFWMIIKP